jgi:Sec-independent protein secretion pathway component TatC
MLFNNIKILIYTIIYICIHISIILIINYNYSDILTYYFFNKLLNFNNLFAITFYEIILTKFYLSFMLTIIICLPIIIIYFYLYIKSGLYYNETKKYKNYYLKGLKIYILELIICMYIFIPLIIKYNNYGTYKNISDNNEFKIIQIYSYGNITSLIIKIIILWVVLALIVLIYKNLNIKKKNIKEIKPLIPRRYIPIIALIIGLFGPFGADPKLQIIITLTILIYLEIHSIIKFWNENRK